MKQLVESIVQPFLETPSRNIALIPGGFKPVTSGHYYIVNEIANNPNIDDVVVLIGHKTRDGITAQQSLEIWNLYQKHLPSNVTVQIAEANSPIIDIHKIIGDNPQNMYYPVVGIRSEADQSDLKRFDSLAKKYTNFKTIVLKGDPDVSGTKARQALLNRDYAVFKQYLPDILNEQEKQQVVEILTRNVNPEPIQENIQSDLTPHIDSINLFAIENGYNIMPLPIVEFICDDVENADNFFGKTGYYNPSTNTITLFTLGRHPKDVARSYAHELIHHMQNMEGVLGNIQTTNTNEDDHLDTIEREAYELGNMLFRNWTDTITNQVEPLNESKFDSTILHVSRDIVNAFKRGKTFKRTYRMERGDDYAEFDLTARFKQVPTLQWPYSISANADMDTMNITIEYDPNSFPQAYNDMVAEIKETVTHEMEHVGQQNFDDMYTPSKKYHSEIEYFTSDEEVPAFVKGLIKRAKTKHIPIEVAMEQFFRENELHFDNPETDWPIVKQVWTNWMINNRGQLKKFLSTAQ
jgi:phosphopantetheine adenylyltransferase